MLVRVSGKLLTLGKQWEVQQIVLACPAFRGQELEESSVQAAYLEKDNYFTQPRFEPT